MKGELKYVKCFVEITSTDDVAIFLDPDEKPKRNGKLLTECSWKAWRDCVKGMVDGKVFSKYEEGCSLPSTHSKDAFTLKKAAEATWHQVYEALLELDGDLREYAFVELKLESFLLYTGASKAAATPKPIRTEPQIIKDLMAAQGCFNGSKSVTVRCPESVRNALDTREIHYKVAWRPSDNGFMIIDSRTDRHMSTDASFFIPIEAVYEMWEDITDKWDVPDHPITADPKDISEEDSFNLEKVYSGCIQAKLGKGWTHRRFRGETRVYHHSYVGPMRALAELGAIRFSMKSWRLV